MNNLQTDQTIKPYNWLEQTLAKRGLKKPDGRNLYKYHIQLSEFETLEEVLKNFNYQINHTFHISSWAAGFCLFVAEWYRREYDSHWSWKSFEERLGVSLPVKKREELLQWGLVEYWRRPIRDRGSSRRELLGSLFLEGGLPWRLIQSGHNIGNIVQKGLKDYYRIEYGNASTTEIVEENIDYLPKALKTNDTVDLIVGIIDHLMELGKRYDLTKQSTPYNYLDQTDPAWRMNFPLPLDETNARNMVNEWLIDTGKRRKQMKEKSNEILDFRCVHHLMEDFSSLQIRTRIYYPPTYIVKLTSGSQINSTRYEVLLYEGDQPILREGIVYGSKQNESVTIRFQKSSTQLVRQNVNLPLNIRIMDSGIQLKKIVLEDSVIEKSTPIVFALKDKEYEFVSNTSCSLKDEKALIRIPRRMSIEGKSIVNAGIISEDYIWYEIEETAYIFDKEQQYIINLNAGNNSRIILLKGEESILDTQPSVTFLGIPGISSSEDNEEKKIFVNDIPIHNLRTVNPSGRVTYTVKDKKDNIILKRRIGILPRNFGFSLKPGLNGNPPEIIFKGLTNNTVLFDRKDVLVEQKFPGDNSTYLLHSQKEDLNVFRVAIKSSQIKKPVIVKIPYPQLGAKLIDSDNKSIDTSVLDINKLLGIRLILNSSLNKKTTMHLNLRLECNNKHIHPELHYQYTLEEEAIIVNFFSLRNDMMQLLSSTRDQDASICVTVSLDSSQNLLNFLVNRYHGDVDFTSSELSIIDPQTKEIISSAFPIAMDLSDPGKEYLLLQERKSENVETGYFLIHNDMKANGPWLVLPHKDSNVNFRPRLYMNLENVTVPNQINSLNSASRHFCHFHDQSVFNNLIENMASDFDDNGWLYMRDLLKNYSHLPLSSFEQWISLSKNPRAIATAVFSLSLNESHLNRIRDELSFLWEFIPVSVWKEVFDGYKLFLESKHIDESVQKLLLSQKLKLITKTVSIMEFLTEYITEGTVKKWEIDLVENILKTWNKENLRKHEGRNWPTVLQKELGIWMNSWVNQEDLLSIVRTLPIKHYSKSVTYLPLFMARITLGLASLQDLNLPPEYTKLNIQKLIDFDQEWFFPAHSLMVSYLLQNTLLRI